MAINFPDSPTLNQEFTSGDRTWIWNGTVWKSKETLLLETGKYTVSDTAPLDPEEGDAWFDSARTKEFIYYDGFWIETSAAAVGLPADDYATETYVDNAIAAIPEVDLTGYATETYVTTAVSNLVDAAPSTLDTLNELAAALNDDASFATTVTTALGNKIDSSEKGEPDGVATLDENGFVPASQLNVDLTALETQIEDLIVFDIMDAY